MSRRTLLIAALALIACEEATPEEIAFQVLSDAGQILSDAGTAIADAGRTLADASTPFADSGTAVAQADASTPAPTKRVLESMCDQKRTATGGPYGMGTMVQHFARFDASADDVRSAWVCDNPSASPLDCPTGAGIACSGAQPPKMACTTAGVMEGTDGSLWILCGEATRARIVLD